MERAVAKRDASYDGIFFTGVRTTGIFCRPSCPARPPLPRNRVYFASAREAVFAGYRPCKRCRPMDVNGRPPEWVAPLLAEVERNPSERITDKDLRGLGLDPARVRRFFRKNYQMTFQAYCRGRRMGEAFKQIREGSPLDDVALGNGYGSHSGFRDAFHRTFGQPPGQCDRADCIVVGWVESPLGPLVVGARADGPGGARGVGRGPLPGRGEGDQPATQGHQSASRGLPRRVELHHQAIGPDALNLLH
jgi:AraC family transcriptional regulator of adaptative response/methylated-DNA-[protein]-cysteine methyltransferase